MTLREIYLHYANVHAKRDDTKFCLHLNLSDHQGQDEPTEALIRHASRIGFPQSHQLIRAWRSGEAHLVLDGFDEVYTAGRATGSRPLEEIRQRSVELIRRFLAETPKSAGIVIAGREHYFNNLNELRRSLAVPVNAIIASATDFTEGQIQQYLSNRSWKATLPDWLPRRPLIVGYLAGRKLFGTVEELAYADPGEGWDALIENLCMREVRPRVELDADSIREIIERLASIARKTAGGLGPINFEDLILVFRDLRNILPDEGVYSTLQRLPGLSINDAQSNTRIFIDDDLVDAARAGDVYRWIVEPKPNSIPDAFRDWANLLGNTGLLVLKHRTMQSGVTARQIQAALTRTRGVDRVGGLQADLVRLLLAVDSSLPSQHTLENLHFPSFYISGDSDASNLTLSGCIVDYLDLSDVETAERLPSLHRCSIEVVAGVTGIDELAKPRIVDSEFGSFTESTDTMSSILQLELPDYTRVAMTVLRKIYTQAGHSRKESGLSRGPLSSKQRELIPRVLADLQSHGAIRKIRRRDTTLWESNRSMSKRVSRVIDSPTTTSDPLVMDPKSK